jgi:cupin superfamily acireductone dioxygenase involved in methionine salvage
MSSKDEFLSTDLYPEDLKSVVQLQKDIIEAKDSLIKNLQEENVFLKSLLISIQEENSTDREVMRILQSQIKHLQNEIDFTKRKYKLMWNKAIENYKKQEDYE